MFNVFHLFSQLNLYFFSTFASFQFLLKAKVELSEQNKPNQRDETQQNNRGYKATWKAFFQWISTTDVILSKMAPNLISHCEQYLKKKNFWLPWT